MAIIVPRPTAFNDLEVPLIAKTPFADMQAGTLKPRYDSARVGLETSPVPRWDLYPEDTAMMGVVQTSRACPFECTFCDVIQYLGRNQRHKPPQAVLDELQKLYDLGYATVSLADDNLTVYRQKARTLLTAVAGWNGKDGRDPISFNTQVSIDLARDDDLMALCVEAGVQTVFVGIETDNGDSLAEAKKRQNLRIDIRDQVEKLVRSGLQVHAGLMIGFDNDTTGAFERQFDLAMSLPVTSYNLSVLVAPVATPLFDRMKAAGRIWVEDGLSEMPAGGLTSNIRMAHITPDELEIGMRWLTSKLFAPDPFIERLRRTAGFLAPAVWAAEGRRRRAPSARVRATFAAVMRRMLRDVDGTAAILRETRRLGAERPEIRDRLQDMTSQHFIKLDGLVRLGLYDPELVQRARPGFWLAGAPMRMSV
jgi:hypothetical protein